MIATLGVEVVAGRKDGVMMDVVVQGEGDRMSAMMMAHGEDERNGTMTEAREEADVMTVVGLDLDQDPEEAKDVMTVTETIVVEVVAKAVTVGVDRQSLMQEAVCELEIIFVPFTINSKQTRFFRMCYVTSRNVFFKKFA